MNIVFFGSSRFAVPALKALSASGHKVICVVTQPDRHKGRGLPLTGTAVKAIAQGSGIRIYQPHNINEPDAVKFIKGLNADLFVVTAYGQILSRSILDVPGIFPVNIHASLLPKYRGAAPINWAIIRGEKSTGISIIKMTEEMDAGPIMLQRGINIDDDDNAITLEGKLSDLAGTLILVSLQSIEDNNYNLTHQENDKVTFAPRLKKEDGRIDWNKPAGDIYNLIRGCVSWPGAFTRYKGKLLKIYKAKVLPLASSAGSPLPGRIADISKEGITAVTGQDKLLIEELQLEGKRTMKAQDFISGHKIHVGDIFDKS